MKKLVGALLFIILLLAGVHALGDEAVDLTSECTFNGRSGKGNSLNDQQYTTSWKAGVRYGEYYMIVDVPEGQKAGAVYLQWLAEPSPMAAQVETDEGWVTVAECDHSFYVQLIELPDLTHFRLIRSDEPGKQFSLCELRVYTSGTLPDTVQRWEEPGDKVDMMFLSGHPDDEVLWFGGAIPYYSVFREKKVLVVCAAMNVPYRRLELMDCLWACGNKVHPVFSILYDDSPRQMNKLLSEWGGKDKCLQRVTGYYRRYKPDVVLLHGVKGEYGHMVHKTVSWLGRECAPLAADPAVYPEQVGQWGTWDIPKIYVHLYEENPIAMDWWQPLDCFGGRTAQDVSRDAMLWHKSQIGHGWTVQDHGDYDNSLFGLYQTNVGEDILKNDFFENIE